MIIFLYGPDGYRLKESVGAVVDSYQKKHKSGMNLYRFDFDYDKNFDELAGAVKSLSFFNEVKLVVVKNIFSAKGGNTSGGNSYSSRLMALIDEFSLDEAKDVVLVFIPSD